MKLVFSLIAILFLLTSSIPFGFSQISTGDSILTEIAPIVSSTPTESRNISVSLQESVDISTNSPSKSNSIIPPTIISESQSFGKTVYLSEHLQIISSILEQTVASNILSVQSQTILDRNLSIDKLKDRKKNSKIESFLADDYVDNEKITINDQSDSYLSLINPLLILENLQYVDFYDQFPLFTDNFYVDYDLQSILSFNNLTNISFSETDQHYVIVIFASLVFFLLLRYDGFELNISKLHQPLAFVFLLILLSSIVITPYSISSTYWPMVYADTSEFAIVLKENSFVLGINNVYSPEKNSNICNF